MTSTSSSYSVPSTGTFRVTANWVVPVDGPPIERGVVEVTDGVIVGLGRGPDPVAIDLGNVAILPALVNCHTHLEFSEIPAPLGPAAPFTNWIGVITSHRHARTVDPAEIIRTGLTESRTAGVGVIGEIATSAASSNVLEAQSCPGVVFQELLAIDPSSIAAVFEKAKEHLGTNTALVAGHNFPRRGLCPHAPYTVHPDLFRGAVELSAQARAPLAFHLAESPDEMQFLESLSGPLVDRFRQVGFWRDGVFSPGMRPLDYLQQLESLEHSLVIHGNYLNSDEQTWLGAHPQCAVVYCVRTHRYFGHPRHPWQNVLNQGGTVVLGTDSRASNPDLSLWDEVRALHHIAPEVPLERLVRMATLDGARALGLERTHGSLTPGKAAAFAIITSPGESTDLWAWLG